MCVLNLGKIYQGSSGGILMIPLQCVHGFGLPVLHYKVGVSYLAISYTI